MNGEFIDIKFFQNFNIQLDLAIEAREIVQGQTGREIPGVKVDKETTDYVTVTTVNIFEKSAEEIMGKPRGTYITLESPAIRQRSPEVQKELVDILSNKLHKLLNLNGENNVLIVGLGNWHATPDSLGPMVIDYTPVTRHVHKYAPDKLIQGMRPVSAIAPGVLGVTGIETAEIIRGVVEKIRPDLIIAIDSLAARNIERISTTIQIADTGINPGSGIGNKRMGINQETMGVPVIAIGVPTVVHAATIAGETCQRFYSALAAHPNMSKVYKRFPHELMQEVIKKLLEPFGGNLMVTPKEIDELIQYTAKTIAGGISAALHPEVTPEQYSIYLQ